MSNAKILLSVLLTGLLAGLLITPTAGLARQASADTLVTVNGEPITSADCDRLIMKVHQSSSTAGMTEDNLRNVLEKRVNDLLILQDALGMGLDQDPGFQTVLDDKLSRHAVDAFVADRFVPPVEVPEDSVQAFFERYFWQVQVRQLSVRTREQAEDLRRTVLSGADLDSLARAVSLDTHRLEGGLHKEKFWADIENVLRAEVRALEPGALSRVFPYREAFAFVRCEQKLPVRQEDLEGARQAITTALRTQARERAWQDFLARWCTTNTIEANPPVLARIQADSALVLTGEFLRDGSEPALICSDGSSVSEVELRRAISHQAMQNAQSGFASLLELARKSTEQDLVLENAARGEGYDQTTAAQTYYWQQWEQGLIEGYLAETVTDRIVFNRDEFESYYRRHEDRFRGPAEVKLDMLILEDEQQAIEAAGRLAAGADFAFIRKQYQPADSPPPGDSRYVPTSMFSQDIGVALEGMEPGQSSSALPIKMGWLIFQLKGRRQGQPLPLDDVEMQIRQVLFQEKFNDLLDERLALLRERSQIVRWSDRINAYFTPEQEG